MPIKNTIETTVNASYLVNGRKGEVRVVVTSKKEKQTQTGSVKSMALFAKNTRYSIYNNGGGYTGL